MISRSSISNKIPSYKYSRQQTTIPSPVRPKRSEGGGLPYHQYQNEGVLQNSALYQGKYYDEELRLYDFHARFYDPATGRFLGGDPQNQFASPYTGMGNMPQMMVDPDGEIAWFVPIIIGAVAGGTVGAIHAANDPNMSIFGGIWRGALIGAAAGTAAISTTAAIAGTSITSATSAGLGATIAGGIAGGVVNGAGMAALTSQNIIDGAWKGGLTGLVSAGVGGSIANAGRTGLGALLGGAAGGATGAGLNGGNVLTGALMGGGISYGTYLATTPKAYRRLTPKVRRSIMSINKLNKDNNYENEYQKNLSESGDPLGLKPYFKGEKGMVPIAGTSDEAALLRLYESSERVGYTIHSHPDDLMGLSTSFRNGQEGGDFGLYLKHRSFWDNPNAQVISVGPSRVSMFTGWNGNWNNPVSQQTSWSLHNHYNFPLIFR